MVSDCVTVGEQTPQETICAVISERILRGVWEPDAKMPTVLALKEEFDVALLTMQRALERLKNDGVTYAVRGKGTYVNPEAPCLRQIALVFPAHRDAENWSLLYEGLLLAAQTEAEAQGLRIAPYYGQGRQLDPVEHARLVEDIKWCRLAGILFAVHPFDLNGTLPMAERLSMPRVAVMSGLGYPDICTIYPAPDSFAQTAARELADCGCRQCACIATVSWSPTMIASLLASLQSVGLEVPARWTQAVPHQDPRWARNCAHQLFAPEQSECPDSLIITDDHLVEASLTGLRDAGRVPGKDVKVIAYRNHPSPHPMMEGVTYLGADLRVLVRQAFLTMEQKRHGEPFSQATALPAVFQDTSHDFS